MSNELIKSEFQLKSTPMKSTPLKKEFDFMHVSEDESPVNLLKSENELRQLLPNLNETKTALQVLSEKNDVLNPMQQTTNALNMSFDLESSDKAWEYWSNFFDCDEHDSCIWFRQCLWHQTKSQPTE